MPVDELHGHMDGLTSDFNKATERIGELQESLKAAETREALSEKKADDLQEELTEAEAQIQVL
jgi:predicted  nucleic acid-binding Zn-ribbon protein